MVGQYINRISSAPSKYRPIGLLTPQSLAKPKLEGGAPATPGAEHWSPWRCSASWRRGSSALQGVANSLMIRTAQLFSN